MQLQVWRTVIDRDASATAEAGRQATATTAGDWSRQPGVRPAGARQAARACHGSVTQGRFPLIPGV